MVRSHTNQSYNIAMTLAALSSAPLLDRDKGAAVSKTELHEIIKRTGFEAVSLEHIMRSSWNTAVATSPESVNQIQSVIAYKISDSISPAPGFSSTVPGARPRAIVYRYIPPVADRKLM